MKHEESLKSLCRIAKETTVRRSLVVLLVLFPFSAVMAREPAEKIATVRTLEELNQRPPIRLKTGWEVRLGFSDGGKAAGPWRLIYCLAKHRDDEKKWRVIRHEGGSFGERLGPVFYQVTAQSHRDAPKLTARIAELLRLPREGNATASWLSLLLLLKVQQLQFGLNQIEGLQQPDFHISRTFEPWGGTHVVNHPELLADLFPLGLEVFTMLSPVVGIHGDHGCSNEKDAFGSHR